MVSKTYIPKLLILKPSKLEDKIASSTGKEKIKTKNIRTDIPIVKAFALATQAPKAPRDIRPITISSTTIATITSKR